MIPLRNDVRTTTRPYVTVTLIVACTLVFLWQLSLGARVSRTVIASLGVIPATLLGGKHLPPEFYLVPAAVTPFTSLFLHGGWLHLIGNMLYLWIFGNNIEDAMGHFRFAVFYALCGVAAALAQSLPDPGSTVPMIGASGAISGVLGAYLLLYPRAHVLVLIPLGFFTPLIQLPAMFVLGFWFVLQLANSLATVAHPGVGGIAVGAHVGGFLAGMVLIPFFKRRGIRFFARPRRRD